MTENSAAERRLRVLYVDDQEDLVQLSARFLRRLGFEVSAHTRPEEALEALRAEPPGFDVLVTDFQMPGMTGIGLAHEAARLRPGLGIVLVSGHLTATVREQAANAGVEAVIEKPFRIKDLATILRQIAGMSPAPAIP